MGRRETKVAIKKAGKKFNKKDKLESLSCSDKSDFTSDESSEKSSSEEVLDLRKKKPSAGRRQGFMFQKKSSSSLKTDESLEKSEMWSEGSQ